MDLARHLEFIDSKKLISHGGSQGGGVALAIAALDPKVFLTCADVPSYSYLKGRLATRNGSIGEVNEYVDSGMITQEEALNLMAKIDKWSKKHKNVIKVHVDDDYHAGSYVYLIPHVCTYKTMGLTIFYIPQCTRELPVQFFCYPDDLRALISGLTKMAKLLKTPKKKYNTSPLVKRTKELEKQLLNSMRNK